MTLPLPVPPVLSQQQQPQPPVAVPVVIPSTKQKQDQAHRCQQFRQFEQSSQPSFDQAFIHLLLKRIHEMFHAQ